jgi:hypothetical protein
MSLHEDLNLDRELITAIKTGAQLDVIKDLIAMGANVNAIIDKQIPLYEAMRYNWLSGQNRNVINYLLDHGADPNILLPGYNQPLLAVTLGQRYAKELLEHGANPNGIEYMEKLTYLETEYENRRVERFKMFLKHGAELHPRLRFKISTYKPFPTNTGNTFTDERNAVINSKYDEMHKAVRMRKLSQEMQGIQQGLRKQAAATKSLKKSLHRLGNPPFVGDLVSEFNIQRPEKPVYMSLASPRTRSVLNKKWTLNKKGGKHRRTLKKS